MASGGCGVAIAGRLRTGREAEASLAGADTRVSGLLGLGWDWRFHEGWGCPKPYIIVNKSMT